MAQTVDETTAPEPVAELVQRRRRWQRIADILFRWREASILVVAILLAIYFQASSSAYLSQDSLRNLSQSLAPWAILAYGEVMLLICGEIDLSVGNVTAFSPLVMYAIWSAGVPLIFALVLALLICAGVGAVNGVVTVLFQVPSFITTLGMLFLLNGITVTVWGFPVETPQEGTFGRFLGNGAYSEFIWAVVIGVGMVILLNRTSWGLHTIATGGNLIGASEAGINVRAIKIGNFVLASVLAGFAGILEAYRITSMDPNAGGTGIMFDAVIAAVIGGTALAGGTGTIVGAFLGALVLAQLTDGFTLIGVSANTFNMIVGIAVLVAMVVNVQLARLRRGGT